MRYFIFNYTSSISRESNTVIFDYWNSFNERDLSNDLKNFYTYNEQCKNIIFIYPGLTSRSENQVEIISEITRKRGADICLIPYNQFGFNTSNFALLEDLVLNGLLHISRKRNVILESDDSFHYVLPSEKHSPFLIRTGNILSTSEEINFISLCIISKVKNWDIDEIACDTSSILLIPYSINYIRSQFGVGLEIPFSSFGSYGKIKDYRFNPRTLVLISASNSGRLEDLIKSYEKDLDFLTIIYNSEQSSNSCLINVNKYLDSFLLNKNKMQYDASKICHYCSLNSIPVIVRGDQFIPSRILIQRVLINTNHIPTWVKRVAPLLTETNSIFAFRRENAGSKRREIFIDLEKLFVADNSEKFINEFNKFVRNNIPSSTNAIIYVDDSGSKLIAEKIKSGLNGPIEILPHTKISSLNPKNTYTILVVSGCVTSGNKFNSISRDLREFKDSSIHYIAIISRLSDVTKLNTLAKNLEFRADKDNHLNKFSSVLSINLSDIHDRLFNFSQRPNWEGELDFWRGVKSNKTDFFSKRISTLVSGEGLINNLFFDSPFQNGVSQNLCLRKNFAFYEFLKPNPAQSEVYFIVSAIFHHLRNPKEIGKRSEDEKFLVQHEHVKTILDPECFKRYNDGVIQACLLRIANYSELNYSVSENDSLEMCETLKDIFKDPHDVKANEAILEFLYALALGKLKLLEYHKNEFINFIHQNFNDNEEISLMIEEIRTRTYIKSN